jgi:twitching motility protein PilJ
MVRNISSQSDEKKKDSLLIINEKDLRILSIPKGKENKSISSQGKAIQEKQKKSLKFISSDKKPLIKSLFNSSISHKHWINVIATELLPVLVLVSTYSLFHSHNLHREIVNEVTTQILEEDANYHEKIKQVGLGFRGQANNTLIIKALESVGKGEKGEKLTSNLNLEVEEILKDEIKARKLEAAALVDVNLRVIADANQENTKSSGSSGKVFNPNNLVSEAIKTGNQVQSHVVVNVDELATYGISVPSYWKDREALIQYTITPVKSKSSQKVVGALIAGEFINSKDFTLKRESNVNSEYNAVYFRQPGGEFVLAKRLNPNQVNLNIELPDKSILAQAAQLKGDTLTGRMVVGNHDYMIAAKAIPNRIKPTEEGYIPDFQDQSLAVLVKGVKNSPDSGIIENWQNYLLYAGFILLCISIRRKMFKKLITEPIENLDLVMQQFVAGDKAARYSDISEDNLGKIGSKFNKIADSFTKESTLLDEELQLGCEFYKIAANIHSSLNIEKILDKAVIHTREALKTDRIVVMSVDGKWEGKITAESVKSSYISMYGANFYDPCFANEYAEKYEQGRVKAINDIYKDDLNDCYVKTLEEYGVKANLIAPIVIDNKLYGLLIAHQCDTPRKWQKGEIKLLEEVANQVSLALANAQLLQRLENTLIHTSSISNIQQRQKELQESEFNKLLWLLETAAKGDLTINIDGKGEFGQITDSLNSLLKNFRKVIEQTKASVNYMDNNLHKNRNVILQMTDNSQQQVYKIQESLNQINKIIPSLKSIEECTKQASNIASNTVQIAAISRQSIGITATNISSLRATVSNTAKQVRDLGESSQQITRAVALMEQIAMQTNILSLNVDIEANRAFDGKAFAMLAEQVSQIAKNAVLATQDIAQMTEKFQRETYAVVQKMEIGSQEVADSFQRVEENKQALNQIANMSKQIQSFVQFISENTVSHLEVSQSLKEFMEDVVLISENTNNESYQFSQSLDSMINLSRELKESVKQFKS